MSLLQRPPLYASKESPDMQSWFQLIWRKFVVGNVPIGAMIDYAGSSVQDGYLACDGSNVSRTTYSDLFTAIGTVWGVGDGSTTFTLPDSRRRVAVGSGGSGTGTLGNATGNYGGAETHALSGAETPPNNTSTSQSGVAVTRATSTHTGNGSAHNNMQPSMIVTKMIRAT